MSFWHAQDALAHPEGWYADPYDRHERRWFSVGRPTPLVRDGEIEGQDEPPGPLPHPPCRPDEPVGGGADALRRVDEAEAGSATAPDLRRADRAPRGPAAATDLAELAIAPRGD